MTIYAFGEGEDGQLGVGRLDATTEQCSTAVKAAVAVPLSGKAVSVSAGSRGSFSLSANGSLFAWGWNVWGSLGIDNTQLSCVLSPTKVPLPERIAKVAIGGWHAAALSVDGTVYTFGGNTNGQLGMKEDEMRDRHFVHGRRGGRVRERQLSDGIHGVDRTKTKCLKFPTPLNLGIRASRIACSGTMTFVVGEGRIFWCGSSDVAAPVSVQQMKEGALTAYQDELREVGSTFFGGEPIIDVAAGGFHVLAQTNPGRVFSWGRGEYGQLGNGGTDDKALPTLVSDIGCGTISRIGCGAWHSAALDVNGNLYAWGRGEFGRLGVGDERSKLRPQRVLLSSPCSSFSLGGTHSAAICNSELFTWGRTTYGRLGRNPIRNLDGGESDQLPDSAPLPQRVLLPGPALEVSCGGRHTLVLVED